MKRYYIAPIFSIIGFVLLSQTGCQQAKVTEESLATTDAANKSVPQITLENDVLDFGEVGFNIKKVGEYKFTNTGEAPLQITKIKKCCGVVAKLDKAPRHRAAGDIRESIEELRLYRHLIFKE